MHRLTDAVDGSATELRRGRHRRVRRADRASTARRGSSRRDAAIFFNFRPDRARQLATKLLERGRRPDDDDALPRRPRRARSRSPSRRSARRSPRCSRAPALRQLHAAETEKYAHVTYFFNGGVEERVAGRDADPRPVPARRPELRPQAGDVRGRGRAPLRRRDRRRLRVRRRQLREPGHGRPHGLDPGGRARRSRPPTRASARSSPRSHARAASASSRPTTATPRRCSSRTASARTPRTRRTPCRSSSRAADCARATAASSPISRRPCSRSSGSNTPPEMTGERCTTPAK